MSDKKKQPIKKRTIVRSFSDISVRDWNAVESEGNIYLSLAYLSTLEEAMSDEIDLFYSISYNEEDKPVLISAFQLVTFIDKRRKYTDYLCKLSYHLHKKIVDAFTINVLVGGNVFSDGENGFTWNKTELSSTEAIDELNEVVKELKKDERVKEKASITLIKEFWAEASSYSDRLKDHSYNDFMIDVNMVLDIHSSWKTMDDYFASMKTKFRTRAKSVYSKSKDLFIKDFDVEEIEKNEELINKLYKDVLEKSDFSFGSMNAKAFAGFKKSLNDKFIFKGVFYNEELVGFSTSFINGTVLEANYVGLDYRYNKDLNIYQRLLYEYVELALVKKSTELHLGRTAELIKSSIGAEPMNMKLYVKHRKTVSNLLLKPIIQSITPSEFELRKPFKVNYSN